MPKLISRFHPVQQLKHFNGCCRNPRLLRLPSAPRARRNLDLRGRLRQRQAKLVAKRLELRAGHLFFRRARSIFLFNILARLSCSLTPFSRSGLSNSSLICCDLFANSRFERSHSFRNFSNIFRFVIFVPRCATDHAIAQ